MCTFLYFAYGSNMLLRRLKQRTPSATVVNVGYVSCRRLTFDKVSRDGSGKCDIESSINLTDRAYGVLYEVSSSEKPELDKAEGLGNGYDQHDVLVTTKSGETHTATTYIATHKEPALWPYHWYKALVIAGALEHQLPTDYIEWIRTFDSKADPNAKRRAENEALLFSS
jgi:gamma-glutamylcyclotransferase